MGNSDHMKTNLFWKFIIGISVIAFLVFLFIWTGDITDKNSGSAYQVEKVIRSIILLTAAWLTTKFITIMFLNPINTSRKKNLPNIVKDVIWVLIYFISVSVILTEVYDKTLASIGAFFISSWAIIGFAAKDLIADCIHGISLDLQADFELGDWIQFKDGTIGKIIGMKMTGADILLPNSSILFINNKMLNSDPMINLSKPERDYYININVVLEHTIPISRGRRILLAAASSAPGVYNRDAKVFSESVQENGVVYVIYFKVPDRGVWLETRHQVIQNVMEYLHKFDLKICQITGEINVAPIPDNVDISFNDRYVTSAITALNMSKLLENCDPEIQKEFSQYMKLRKFHSGEFIIKQGEDGDSMFIIAEGVVDIDSEGVLNRDKNNMGNDPVEYRVSCLVDGDCFGEMELLFGEKRTATVIARTDVVLYEINREAIKNIASKNSDFIDKINESLAKRKVYSDQFRKD